MRLLILQYVMLLFPSIMFTVSCLQYRNTICLLFSLFLLLTDWTSAICCNMAIFRKYRKMVFCVILTIIVVDISMKYEFSNLFIFSKKNVVVAKNDEMTTIKPATVLAAVVEVSAILSRTYIAELEDTRRNLLKTNITIQMKRGNLTALYANNHAHFTSKLRDLRMKIHSIWFSESDNVLAPPLVTKYYNAIMSDCRVYKRYCPRDNSTCFSRPEDVVKPFPFSKAIMQDITVSRFSVKSKANTELRHNFTYILVIAGAFVTVDGEVIQDDLAIVPIGCQMTKHLHYFQPTNSPERHREVFVLAQHRGTTFFHFLIETLTRIAAYLSFLMRHPSIKILVKKETSFTVKFLAALGIEPSRLVGGNIQADIVYMPAGTGCGHAPIFNAQFLSMQFRAGMSEPAPPRDTIILIRRSKKRWFDHHDDILAMLRRHADSVGLKTVVYGDNPVPGFHETRQLFNRAYIVVAPHGAGESNLIFSQPGTILVEGICYDSRGHPNWCYRIMAAVLGHRYCGLMFEKQCMNITAADVEPYVKYYVRKFIS